MNKAWALAASIIFPSAAFSAQVVEVHSGDSLTVLSNGRPVTLQLARIDAPELDQPFGDASRRSLEDLCKGKAAEYVIVKSRTKKKREALVTCEDVDASRAQLKRGMAWLVPHPDTDPGYTLIQDFVWRDKVGLWKDPDPVPPWEWKGGKK